jgi:hypothetical protein
MSMSYHISFVRDDEIVGFLGREGMDDEVLRENQREAVVMHDLKAASRLAQELTKVILPNRLPKASPREVLMFHFVTDIWLTDLNNREVVSRFAQKYQIKVISAATGRAVETYPYEPR